MHLLKFFSITSLLTVVLVTNQSYASELDTPIFHLSKEIPASIVVDHISDGWHGQNKLDVTKEVVIEEIQNVLNQDIEKIKGILNIRPSRWTNIQAEAEYIIRFDSIEYIGASVQNSKFKIKLSIAEQENYSTENEIRFAPRLNNKSYFGEGTAIHDRSHSMGHIIREMIRSSFADALEDALSKINVQSILYPKYIYINPELIRSSTCILNDNQQVINLKNCSNVEKVIVNRLRKMVSGQVDDSGFSDLLFTADPKQAQHTIEFQSFHYSGHKDGFASIKVKFTIDGEEALYSGYGEATKDWGFDYSFMLELAFREAFYNAIRKMDLK